MIKQIKFLVLDVWDFIRKDFKLAAYAYALAVIALTIVFVYGTDLGYSVGRNTIPTSNKIVNNIIMFSIIYFLIAIPVLLIQGKRRELSNPMFYVKGLLFMLVLGFSDAFSFRNVLNLSEFSPKEQDYIFRLLWRMCNLIFVLPVLIVLRVFFDKNVKGLYGLGKGNHHVRAYLYLFIVILPVLAIVSFTPDFQSYYPMYKPWNFEGVFGNPTWLNALIFEIVYASDFVMVELFFRGALVIGMASLMGRSAVLPMIAVYVALHFGKPVMETISAAFGGYFLGALAYQTRHIWGGVIIHIGIALFIELIRFVQHYLLGVG